METTVNDISLNHIMFGEISAWFYKALGGIKPDPANPGFKNVMLEPHFVAGLEQLEAKHQGPYGEIISSWKRSDGRIQYSVTIPPNSTATLLLQANDITASDTEAIERQENGLFTIRLQSGQYEFMIEE